MRNITAEPSRIIRAMVIAMALSALAACSVLDDGTPSLKIKGLVVAQYGHAKGCRLRVTALRDGQWITTFDVGHSININWASRYFYDADRGAYPGMQFELSCANKLVTASRVITDAQMVEANSKINLGRLVVQ